MLLLLSMFELGGALAGDSGDSVSNAEPSELVGARGDLYWEVLLKF